MTISYLMKPLLAKSRPYFDDASLGDTKINDCSAEFGNPSGHSVGTVQFVFNMLWHYQEIHELFFLKNPLKLKVLKTLAYLYMMGVLYSRVYLGRHTFD